MNGKTAVRRAMERRAITQKQLAKMLNIKSQPVIAERLSDSAKSLRLENFVEMMNACGFDVLVRDRNGGRNGVEWVIDNEPTVVAPIEEPKLTTENIDLDKLLG